MNFLFPLALLLAGLAALPILAHALRRGPLRAERFPAAHLIPKISDVTERRGKIEDKLLLALRVLLLLALALLGSAPLLRCSRLGIARNAGESVALALVIDDSASMQNEINGISRFTLAKKSAAGLLATAKPGDTFSVILAGAPARVVTHASSDIDGVRQLILNLPVTDRGTDLFAALTIAKSSLESLPQPQKQVVLFSDGATTETLPEKNDVAFSMPVPELQTSAENCALENGRRQEVRGTLELHCTAGASLNGKTVALYRAKRSSDALLVADGASLGVLPAKEGELSLSLPKNTEGDVFFARLEPSKDALRADDEVLLVSAESTPAVAVRSDARAKTNGTPLIEIALRAVAPSLRVRPLLSLYDRPEDGAGLSALLIDDPPGFSPEVASTLETFVRDGGVLLVFFGPNATNAPLGQTFWPLLTGAPTLEKKASENAPANPELKLPEAFNTWTDLGAKERMLVSLGKEDRVLARFDDGAPLVFERTLGQGLILGTTLPSSVDESDFALRPAFLALLERVTNEAARRRGALLSIAGAAWPIPADAEVTGPGGPLPRRQEDGQTLVEANLVGRYSVLLGKRTEQRYVERSPLETVGSPRHLVGSGSASLTEVKPVPLDISREIALGILGLGALELGVRYFGRKKRRARGPASHASDPSPIESP